MTNILQFVPRTPSNNNTSEASQNPASAFELIELASVRKSVEPLVEQPTSDEQKAAAAAQLHQGLQEAMVGYLEDYGITLDDGFYSDMYHIQPILMAIVQRRLGISSTLADNLATLERNKNQSR